MSKCQTVWIQLGPDIFGSFLDPHCLQMFSSDDTSRRIADTTCLLNPFMPNVFPILINWTSPFPDLGLLGGIFHFYSNFKRTFCKQMVEKLIRRRDLRRLIWFSTVCRCPTKSTLCLDGLMKMSVSRNKWGHHIHWILAIYFFRGKWFVSVLLYVILQ